MMVFVLSCYERRRLDYPLLHKGGDVGDPPKNPLATLPRGLDSDGYQLAQSLLVITNNIHCQNLLLSLFIATCCSQLVPFLVNCNIRPVAAFSLPRVRQTSGIYCGPHSTPTKSLIPLSHPCFLFATLLCFACH